MTLFIGGPWHNEDRPLTEAQRWQAYAVPELTDQGWRMVIYNHLRFMNGMRVLGTVMVEASWDTMAAEACARAWLDEHPGQPLPW